MAPLSIQAYKPQTEGHYSLSFLVSQPPCILSSYASLLQFFGLNHRPQSGSAHISPFPQLLKYPRPALKALHDPASSCYSSDPDPTADIKPVPFSSSFCPLYLEYSTFLFICPFVFSFNFSFSEKCPLTSNLPSPASHPTPPVVVTHLTVLSVFPVKRESLDAGYSL